jgi:hypothetical protein
MPDMSNNNDTPKRTNLKPREAGALKMVSYRLPCDTIANIKHVAARDGVTQAAVIRRGVDAQVQCVTEGENGACRACDGA